MRRLALCVALLLAWGGELGAQGMPSTGAMRIQDPTSGSLARVNHFGALYVVFPPDSADDADSQTGKSPKHITSVVHVSGIIRGFGSQGTAVTMTGSSLDVNCTSGCAGTPGPTPHISSVTHIAGAVSLVSRAGIYATVTGTSLDVNCTAGCAGGSSDAVNVFHQSTVRHISSVTHVAGYGAFHVSGLGVPGQTHGGVFTIQGVTGMVPMDVQQGPARWPISHITSVTHIYGITSLVARDGTYAAFTGTSVNVNLTNTPPVTQSGEWNVRHIGARLHVVLIPSSNANDIIAVHATQTGTWNIGHISGQVHVLAIHASGALRAWRVASCGTAATLSIATNRARRELRLTNMGTSNIYIGYGTTGHVALTTSNGWPMHASSSTGGSNGPVILGDYTGPIACITDLGSQQLGVMEILKN